MGFSDPQQIAAFTATGRKEARLRANGRKLEPCRTHGRGEEALTTADDQTKLRQVLIQLAVHVLR